MKSVNFSDRESVIFSFLDHELVLWLYYCLYMSENTFDFREPISFYTFLFFVWISVGFLKTITKVLLSLNE